ncbi:Predicted Zn-dependent peptidase [gamma proteobacterium HdN1]|nr:Predicted Zn-dependent peptidase [gamma proteobacterium HdN1]
MSAPYSFAANASPTASTLGTVGASTAASTPAERTFEHTLENGLRIIVREDHRAPVMVSQIWYRVGSSYEPTGKTGMSHALEHMMFKGTPKVPTGEFSRIVASYGGEENAFTSYDYTGYYQMMGANNLPLSFELEADRMANALMPDDEFAKEIEVIKEERRMRTDDNPNALAWERFQAAAYLSSGYHHPVIGWRADLNDMSAEDARQWYKRWYAPNNATVVVVGDVKADDVFALAKRYFGPLARKTLPPAPRNLEAPPLGERRLRVEAPARVPALFIGYNVPGINTASDPADVYALRMAAGVLDGGVSARLETELIRGSKVAASIGTSYNGYSLGDDLFSITGIPSQGISHQALEQAIQTEIDRLQNTLPTEDEMQRVRAQIVSGLIYKQDSISGQAYEIGALVSIGRDWREGDLQAQQLAAVTPEQVQAAARKYLVAARRTVAELIPAAAQKAQSQEAQKQEAQKEAHP